MVTYLYRNAFNADYDFETPALGSALNFWLSTSSSISFNCLREWAGEKMADNLFGMGSSIIFEAIPTAAAPLSVMGGGQQNRGGKRRRDWIEPSRHLRSSDSHIDGVFPWTT